MVLYAQTGVGRPVPDWLPSSVVRKAALKLWIPFHGFAMNSGRASKHPSRMIKHTLCQSKGISISTSRTCKASSPFLQSTKPDTPAVQLPSSLHSTHSLYRPSLSSRKYFLTCSRNNGPISTRTSSPSASPLPTNLLTSLSHCPTISTPIPASSPSPSLVPEAIYPSHARISLTSAGKNLTSKLNGRTRSRTLCSEGMVSSGSLEVWRLLAEARRDGEVTGPRSRSRVRRR